MLLQYATSTTIAKYIINIVVIMKKLWIDYETDKIVRYCSTVRL